MKMNRMLRRMLPVFFVCCGTLAVSGTADAAALRLSLEECVERTLASDQAIVSAEANAESSAWQMRSARRAAGPTVSWGAQAYRIGGRDYREAPFDKTFNNTLSVEIPLYTGGQIEGAVERYRQQTNAAMFGIEGEMQAARFRAVEAYYNVLQRENLVQVAESAVRMVSEQLRLLNIQFNEGAIARSDVIQMQVQMAEYEQSLIGARGDLAVAEATLCSVVGLPAGTEIELADTLTYEPYEPSLEECTDYGLRNRPDRAAADARIMEAEAQRATAMHGSRPRVVGVLTKNMVGSEAFRQDRNANWRAGLELRWNIFDNQVTAADVRAAEKAREKAVADANETERVVRLDIRRAYTQMRTAEEKIHTAHAAIEQAQKNNMLAEVRYKEGVDIILKVTDAQEKLVRARTNYYTALYEYNLNKAGLARAMGVSVAMDVPRDRMAAEHGRSPLQAAGDAALSLPPGGQPADRGTE